MAGYSVGIDFGTCSIKISNYDENRKKVYQIKVDRNDKNADSKVPNVIEYSGRDTFRVGDAARKQKALKNINIVDLIKRKLELESWSYDFAGLGFKLTAEEIARDIFRWIKDKTEEQGKPIENAVVTVPVCFTEIQKQRIIGAAQGAGIPVLDTITEPVAALFSIEELFEEACEENVVVFDFGGATLDLCLFHIENDGDGGIAIEIEGSCGVDFGGVDITRLIYEDIIHPKYRDVIDEEISQDVLHRMESDLLDVTEKMKTELFQSGEEQCEDFFNLPYSSKTLEMELTLEEALKCFEDHKIKEIIWNVLEQLFDDSSIERDEVTMVRVFGGTSRILYIRELLEEYFGSDVFDLDSYDEDKVYNAVANGAARYVSILLDKDSDVRITNAIPFYVGVNKGGKFQVVIKRYQKYDIFTPLRRLKDIVEEDEPWKVALYQHFAADQVSIGGEAGAVYLGSLTLAPGLYEDFDRVMYKFGVNRSGKIVGRFFNINKENDPVPAEEKEIVIGG